MKNIRSLCGALAVLLMLLLILPSCNMEIADISERLLQNIVDLDLTDAESDDEFEEEHATINGIPRDQATETECIDEEPERVEGGEYSTNTDTFYEQPIETEYNDSFINGDDVIGSETEIIDTEVEDSTSDTEDAPYIDVLQSYHSITVYDPDKARSVVEAIRNGYDEFIEESMKGYRYEGMNYKGPDSESAHFIANVMLNASLVLPKGFFEAEYFKITCVPAHNFLVISYRINNVNYTFRYENIEYMDYYSVRNYDFIEESLDGIDFRMFPSSDGERWGIFDHPDMSDRFIEVIVNNENYDFGQFEFYRMPKN